MRYFKLVLSILFLIANTVHATPAKPESGVEYITLTTPQSVAQKDKKIEVIEFFMYHCPACNMLDPVLNVWVKAQGSKIDFKRIHVPLKGAKDVEAHLFLTLQALGMEDTLHSKVFHTWHVLHIQLNTDEDNVDWAVKNGIPKEKFLSVYNSFSVLSKLQHLSQIAANYQVDSTPSIVVDGRYLTSMALVSEGNKAIPNSKIADATLEVVDALVAQALKKSQTGS